MAGTLFVVATPIGNLEDLSFRALRILKEVDLVAAEDTRRTAKLLAHYAIRKPMVSLHEHNERRETPRLLARLSAGESIALVSDAGTPGISDPGEHLVRAVREAGLPVSPIPGPSAVMAALSTSGVPAGRFTFMGFPPRGGRDRSDWFNDLSNQPDTVIFFEAPHRITRTLDEVTQLLVNRQIIVHREISKINEEYIEQPNNVISGQVKPVGELVIVVSPRKTEPLSASAAAASIAKAVAIIDLLTENDSFSIDDAASIAASGLAIDEAAVRKAHKKHRFAVKQRS